MHALEPSASSFSVVTSRYVMMRNYSGETEIVACVDSKQNNTHTAPSPRAPLLLLNSVTSETPTGRNEQIISEAVNDPQALLQRNSSGPRAMYLFRVSLFKDAALSFEDRANEIQVDLH